MRGVLNLPEVKVYVKSLLRRGFSASEATTIARHGYPNCRHDAKNAYHYIDARGSSWSVCLSCRRRKKVW